MEPFVRDGDVITVTPLQQAEPVVGHVVAFVHPESGNLVVHRVVARQGDSYLLQGDSGPRHGDGMIQRENLLGLVKRVERNGRDIGLGLGPERALIARLSRAGRLMPLRTWLASWLKPLLRR
jgi:hypothetical protein